MDLEFARKRYVKNIFQHNRWGRVDGRSLVITHDKRENLYLAMQNARGDGRVLEKDDVDVKDLLELGRVIIEQSALDEILAEHQSDLSTKVKIVV